MKIHRFFRNSLLAITASLTYVQTIHAGVINGPRFADRLIAQNARDGFAPMLFAGHQQAVISVEGKTSAPLVLFVYNPDGSLYTSQSVQPFTKRTVWFDPPTTGYYTIVVTNVSEFYAGRYILTTN